MAMYDYEYTHFTNFTDEKQKIAFLEGLKTVEGYLGETYPLVINGERIFTKKTQNSLNPADHKQVIGTISQAGISEVDMAFEAADNAFKTWKKTPAKVRADVLFKAAAIIRRRKMEFSALMTYEAGKPWPEADADTAEAIDFLEYYGRQILEMESIDQKILSRDKFERNEYKYIPLGIAAVITPWNFPLAILAGMTTANVVAGNTVILKPAETTQVIAYKFLEVLEEAGLPKGVVNFIPGKGSEIGDHIVLHPKTRLISFTGSKTVGIRINQNAAVISKGQIWLKRVIAEMGGKDAIVVDNDADIDMAAKAVAASAFGFSGQKCSACSRVIAHQDIYDELLEKTIMETKKIIVGDPRNQATFMGPVNSKKAFDSISNYIEVGRKEGKIVHGGTYDEETGYFIQPTIIADLDPNSRIMQEEIFGPVVGFTKVKDFDEAIAVANGTEYGLTGAVISRNRAHLEQAREEFHVGNLYFNRKCTGAIVGYQPFGGFNMSGTDSKAGGPDYLMLHMQGKTVSEQL